MSKVMLNQYHPDSVSPPGETLLETLEERAISQDELARRSGLTQQTIQGILTGRVEITAEFSRQLEQALGISASFWNNRERNYRQSLEKQSLSQTFETTSTQPYSTNSMVQKPSPPKPTAKPTVKSGAKKYQTDRKVQSSGIVDTIVGYINQLEGGLQSYPIRILVQHAEEFGPYLKQQRLETNQVRKFLDAVKRLKADLTEQEDFSKIEREVVLLKPKLAYAAARQKAAKPLSQVMSAAIDKVESQEDFACFVQLIEAIIAYHKAEGGK